MREELPVFMQDQKTYEFLREAKSAIPKGTRVYIVGGAVRNALYFKQFNNLLPQRDYDILLIGDKDAYVRNLRALGFTYGFIRRKHEITLKKKRVPKPKDRFADFVFLDIHISEEKSVAKNLKDNSNFTINGFALSLKDIDSKQWHKKIISMPHAEADLRSRQLRVNAIAHPANLFAAMRFMSKGFKAPSKDEVHELLLALGTLESWRYKRNIQKLYAYVGGESAARKLAKKLKIRHDIFDFATIKRLRTLCKR